MVTSTDKASLAASMATALELRNAHWDVHPIVAAKAKLPTASIMTAMAHVKRAGRKQRGSVAFWAHPVTGKSFCIAVLRAHLPIEFPDCGIFAYEAKTKQRTQEKTEKKATQGSHAKEAEFIHDLLMEMDYEPAVAFRLPERRRQIRKALYALSGPARHLILIIDEAQELDELEMGWLKSILNWLAKVEVRVTVVLFGQVELLEQRKSIESDFRSDLDVRFTRLLFEFFGIRNVQDMLIPLQACDDGSEYPIGSGLSYTQFLFPLAFQAGFRMARLAKPLLDAFMKVSPLRAGETGVAMEFVADALRELAEMMRESDGPQLSVGPKELERAVRASGYANRKPVRNPTNTT